ncbi:hypothetical protein FOC1_g10002633 [Fusarium oxysporum f. sp. cubense race 1]|uniref:CBM-cenC domain-containing protein n=1 Tax=Fusarium oxysporum f. sp. cubense (strain race 1) TaxID=1229664 RepID=N4U260_FUSC1|nr:hypothetical protein FOC1_g10002633 [Fusarium oxysporum f. sp. cubense race 1]
MTAKTIMTAFIAALLLAGSEAGPCKPRPRTTNILTTVEITSSSTKATSTTEAGLSTTDIYSTGYLIFTTDQSESTSETSTESKDTTTTSAPVISTTETSSSVALTSSVIESKVSLTKELTSEMIESCTEESTTTEASFTTILSTSAPELSPTVIKSSTGVSTVTEDATTTTISALETSSAVDISSTIVESSTEITTSSQEPTATVSISTTVLIPTTTESTTTSEVTTTTTTEAAGPPTLVNLGFDDTTEPWSVTQPNLVSLSLDNNIKHDGRSSARMSFSTAGGSTSYISQAYSSPAQAGVGYPASAWVRPGPGCTIAVLGCAYGNAGLFAGRRTIVVTATSTQPGTIDQWQEVSYTCTYTQSQIDQGGLALNIGFMCISGSEAWIDSVTFSGQ